MVVVTKISRGIEYENSMAVEVCSCNSKILLITCSIIVIAERSIVVVMEEIGYRFVIVSSCTVVFSIKYILGIISARTASCVVQPLATSHFIISARTAS